MSRIEQESTSPVMASLNSSVNSAPNHSSGRLFINIVEARDIIVKRTVIDQSQLYCVVQFEGNELVTREAAKKLDGPIATLTRMGTSVNPLWKHEAIFDVTRADGEVVITIFDRRPGNKEEDFLGCVKIRPPRVNGKLQDNWFRLLPRQWKEKVSGDIHIVLGYQQGEKKPLTPDDFDLLKVLGKGSFGKVLQVRKKDTNRVYAMKVLSKKDIIKRHEVEHTMAERNILKHTNFPFLVGLKFAYQTSDKLYLVLDFMNGGELFFHLQQAGRFDEERALFYSAEIVLALEHLHTQNVVYRDLKPENILLDSTGHVALTDFGLCKENMNESSTTKTFCGTAEYLAPEVLLGKGYNRSVDWWTLGILMYEMIVGTPPFSGENTNAMYRKILYTDAQFPDFVTPVAQSLIKALLNRDSKLRLGSGADDATPIKAHPYFASVHWDRLLKRQLKPPFKPNVESETDVSNFDPSFTDMEAETILDSPANGGGKSVMGKSVLSKTFQKEFEGFTYNDDSFLDKKSKTDGAHQ